jgi:hypothetical protein
LATLDVTEVDGHLDLFAGHPSGQVEGVDDAGYRDVYRGAAHPEDRTAASGCVPVDRGVTVGEHGVPPRRVGIVQSIGQVRHQHRATFDDRALFEIECRVVAEDLIFQATELGSRLDAELLTEVHPRRGERPQGICLPTRPVQSQHLLRPEPLVERVLGDQGM